MSSGGTKRRARRNYPEACGPRAPGLKAHHGVGEMPLFAKADSEADGGRGTGQFAPLIGSAESISRTISTWPKSITATPSIAETQWVSLLMTKHLLSNSYLHRSQASR